MSKRYKKRRKTNIFEEYGFPKTQIWEEKSVFWENNPFLGIIFWEKTVRKKTGGALCVRKVTREDVKRRI